MTDIQDHQQEKSAEDVDLAMKAFHKRLQSAGLKSTRQRDIIAERFFALDKHISAEELLNEVRTIKDRVGYATVYRTLKLLVEQGFALEKDFGDGYKRYDPVHNQDPHHDHLICLDCRSVIEFNDESLTERLDRVATQMGYALKRKKIELYAECNIQNCPNRVNE